MSDNTEEEMAEQAENDETEQGPEAEIEQYREVVSNMHDNLDDIKNGGAALSQEIQQKAEEEENEELQRIWLQLANAAQQASRRVQQGDDNVVRAGL